ncbi:hypothetical protein SNOG_07830 [Parastagonospora nodorum SN15]|uniref:WDR59/RTC1-like RING zinc finger domain-containing protein n=1 Tax=Phaeosphaeria nodorum (strain SN15 / ATCC MYA-4574 / FGSC 10173) TaxID=321614 RepID=Q0UK84_PHANO|nr:hypothetical protein SNOG_07830 [Parastagonospora nodorum SN15]EAT85296.2 hypothetical protein SNOG_07830 [Parastagonospora nodorum SN15]
MARSGLSSLLATRQHHHHPNADEMAAAAASLSAFDSDTFCNTVSIAVDDEIGSASISPSGRDVVLASQSGLRIIDLDNPYSLPLYIPNHFSWKVADVQWSPFAARAEWIASTRNQQALVYNLSMPFNNKKAPIEFTLRAHDRAITDINFSAHHPDLLATCGMDSYVFVHDLRSQQVPLKLADWEAGAHQVKWNRQDERIIASSHDKYLHIWDVRHGTKPMSTIAAHSTKIYGIDWNRNDPRKILTCSLDQTIKLWNNVGVNTNITTPRRTIVTDYPVWRARHTPFPHGILAMPQRGSSSLFLYKHINDSAKETFNEDPVHQFRGHEPESQVREFLWRSRGSTNHGVDNRDFQLVSWGTDNHLRLHHITPELLESTVGYRKGEALIEKPSTTRGGATYVSYRDGPIQTTTAMAQNDFGPPRAPQKGNLATLLQNTTISEQSYMFNGKTRNGKPGHGGNMLPRETMTATPIRRTDPRVVAHIKWIEGVQVGAGPDIEDVRQRSSPDNSLPRKPYDFHVEISDVGKRYKNLNFEDINKQNRSITVSFNGPWGEADNFVDDNKLVFLRFTIRFPDDYPRIIEKNDRGEDVAKPGKPLQIEFEKTTASITLDEQFDLTEDMERIAQTCAAQKREALGAILSYALGERELRDSLHLEDDVPLPEYDSLPGEETSSDEDDIPHEGEFTTDVMQSSHTNANIPLPNQCTARFSSFGSLVVARLPTTSTAPALGALFRIGRTLRHGPSKDDIFDSFGRFNARPAHDSNAGSSPASSAGSWELSSSPSSNSDSDHEVNAHIGNFQPPLAWREQVLVLARRALVRIKRKDSGLDLQFDEADTVTNPKLTGRIKWGNHAVVTWLIPALFAHFERLADTQMLAMLSCIFAEPAAREGATSAMAKMRHSHLPMSMEAPAFSLDYFASSDAAWSLFKPTISVPSMPAHSRHATPVTDLGWSKSPKNVGVYGSHGSSNGPWGSDTIPSEPVTPRSFTTIRKRNVFFATSQITNRGPFDICADERSHLGKRTSFGQSDLINMDDMYDSDSEYEGVDEEGRFGNEGASEYTRPIRPGEGGNDNNSGGIRVKLKNQDQFDDEACVSRPLLDMSKDWLHRAWREQYAELLGCWGLVSARAEVLKFNGLVSYFPPEAPRNVAKTETSYLSIKRASNVEANTPASARLSRASTALAPPSINGAQAKRTPAASLRNFSFNPEATEFQPGTVSFTAAETLAPPPDVFITSEQYLQLSIPTPTPSKELDESLGGLGASPGQDRLLHPRGSRQARPDLSRRTSNVSGSSWGVGRSPSAVATTSAAKPTEPEPIYSCSICWIRVCGRVYLCPACLHVAHFDCMDDELGMDDGECVVGCGCGCGFEDDDERTRMEAYIDGVRAANAAGVAWDESGGWLQLASTDDAHGDSLHESTDKSGAVHDDKRERERERVTGRTSKTTSPTPTTSTMRKRKKEKKKPRASGLSYY